MANAKFVGVPKAEGESILVTDASNLGGGGTLFQWQALEGVEFNSAISQWSTDGLNQDVTLKQSCPCGQMGPSCPGPLELEMEPSQG